jgi:heme/copper-type cytochrome/quinol oxidase subunit 3
MADHHTYSREEIAARLGVPDRRHNALLFRRTGRFGMALLLVSLGILFAASMLGYVLLHWWVRQPKRMFIDGAWQTVTPVVPDLVVPWTLWISTAVILISSLTIHRALHAVALERQRTFRGMLLATLGLAIAFMAVQAPSLAALLQQHADLRAQVDQPLGLYGLVFFLILVHALHVIGGVIPLAVLTRAAFRGRYDHESHEPIRLITMYWHFLDVVWLVMFAVLLTVG